MCTFISFIEFFFLLFIEIHTICKFFFTIGMFDILIDDMSDWIKRSYSYT